MKNPHIEYIDLLIDNAMDRGGELTEGQSYALAQEVLRLRRVIAGLAPCFVHVVEEAVEFEREMEESGVDPDEPALVEFREVMKRLRVLFLDKA